MARQKGNNKLEGTIDELTYYHSPHGYLVRRKAKNQSDRIKNDPAYAGTRQNATEFGQVAKAAGQIRKLMGYILQPCADWTFTSRLISVLHKVMKEDTRHEHGLRRVFHSLQYPAGQALLIGFDLHPEKPLDSILKAFYVADAQTGTIHITLDEDALKHPPSSTHVCFTSAWIRLEPEYNRENAVITKLEPLSLIDLPDNLSIIPATSLRGQGPAILMLHIQFYRKNGDKLEPLQENRCGQVVGVG